MGFKDQALTDIGKVFLDLDTFAENHDIEGVTIPCVIQTDQLTRLAQGHTIGMIEADLVVYAKEADLPNGKTPGSNLNVDGRELLVVSWGVTSGLVEIALRQNRMM